MDLDPARLAFDRRVAMVREFNRFYTLLLGLLDGGLHESRFSLTEMRVLYELAHRDDLAATDLREALGLDASYLSRILNGFEKRGLVRRKRSAGDRRRVDLELTAKGLAAYEPLDTRATDQVAALLAPLPEQRQERVVHAMKTVGEILGARDPRSGGAVALRDPVPGDLGRIVHRQAVLYHEEHGWDLRYEGLISKIVGEFVERFDGDSERCWIAERDGEVVGSVFLVKKSKTVARLRLLYVEPAARGLGLGTRLVEECLAFARAKGYERMTLWTNSVLVAARRIYERAGFELVAEEKHALFGPESTGQTWELDL